MSEKVKCVYYCRVSTNSDDQLNSINYQKDFFKDFIDRNKDKYTVYKNESNMFTGIYDDKGISGTLLHREKFEHMLAECGLDCKEYKYKVYTRTDVDDGKYSIEYKDYQIQYNENAKNPLFSDIIVKSTSRFARNIMVTEILRKLSAIGVYVTFLDINKSTRNPDDIMIIQLFQQFDEMFSRDLSKKLLLANKQSAENQILRSNGNIFGFKYLSRRITKKPNNQLKIIEKEAYIIQMIFRLYLGCLKVENEDNPDNMSDCNFECSACTIYPNLTSMDGIGFRMILHTLNNIYGFKTRKGKDFKQTTLKHIMENEKYAGYLNNRKYEHPTIFETSGKIKIREDYELIYRPDLIEPIISKELFDLCTKKRTVKAGDSTGIYKGKATKYKGFIRCGNCGNVYTHNVSNDNKGYYNCKTKKQKGMKVCNNINVFDTQIEDNINELCNSELNDLITSENIRVVNVLVNEIIDKLDFIERNRNPEEVSILKDSIEKDKRALQRLIIDKAMADYPELFNEPITEINDRLKNTTEIYDKLTKKPKTYIEECLTLFNTCNEIIDSSENMQETYTEEEIRELVECFNIYGEPIRVKGLWQSPKPSIVPVLKVTATARKLTNLEVSIFTTRDLGIDLGVNNTELENVKAYLLDLEKKLNSFKETYN